MATGPVSIPTDGRNACANHSEKPSSCRCVTCEIFMCDECLTAHKNWPGFKTHSVLTLEELSKPENRRKARGRLHCKEHEGKKLKFYCETCQVLICRYCMDFDHLKLAHSCLPIEKATPRQRHALETCRVMLNVKQTEGEKSFAIISDAENALKTAAEKAVNDLSRQRQSIMETVEDAFQAKMSEVQNLYTKFQADLYVKGIEVGKFLEKTRSANIMSRNVLRRGSDEDVLQSAKIIQEVLKTIEQEWQGVKNVSTTVVTPNWYAVKPMNIETISDMLGDVVPLVFTDSVILRNIEHAYQMYEWFEDGSEWKLCYRATRDGWFARNFHSHCDNQGPTVTLVKVDEYIFGGFIDGNWRGPVGKSKQAFMFSLKNAAGLPSFRAPIMKKTKAYVGDDSHGPLFGSGSTSEGHDLFISGHPPTIKCYSDFGHSYLLPAEYQPGTSEARTLLAGSLQFTPCEIEVFYQQHKRR